MIILINEKAWKKRAKKLVEAKNYIIFDVSGDETGALTKYANVVAMSGLNPPNKLVKARLDKSGDVISKDKLKKLESKYLKGKDFRVATMAICKSLVKNDGDLNLFVVLRNKSYKAYAPKVKKRIEKILDVGDIACVYLYEDVEENKKILKRTMRGKHLKKLALNLRELEKKLDRK